MNHELDHHPKHMVFQNLSKIKKCIDCMMEVASNNPEADDLILNHAWMVDHIATSADDLQEACDFMCYRLGEDNTTRVENVQLVQAAPDTFESKNFRASNFYSFILESDAGTCKCGSDCKCKDCKTHKRGKYAEGSEE